MMKKYKTYLGYSYLNYEDRKIIDNQIKLYIRSKKLSRTYKKLDYKFIKLHDFGYYSIFEHFLVGTIYQNNIFWTVDKYCKDENIHFYAPALRNTMTEIMVKYYLAYMKRGLNTKLDTIVLLYLNDICNKSRTKFLKEYNQIKSNISEHVKSKCEWMVDDLKYNRVIKLRNIENLVEL